MESIVAHRGCSSQAPENTMPAFEKAVDLPIYGIETDIQMTKDGVLVVYHDSHLKKIGRRGRIDQYDWKTLSAEDFGLWFSSEYRHTRIPSLKKVLSVFGQKTRWLLEIKTGYGRNPYHRNLSMCRKVWEMVRSMSLGDQVEILCFDWRILRDMHKRVPQLRYVLNAKKPPPLHPDHVEKWAFLSAYSIRHRKVNRAFVEKAHGLGKPVYSYTTNDEDSLQRVRQAGVDVIMTDRPEWLLGS